MNGRDAASVHGSSGSPWPGAESSAATPIGECPKCGGMRYALLVHHCTTALRIVPQTFQWRIRP